MALRRLGIFGNASRADALTAAHAVLRFAKRRHLRVSAETAMALALQEPRVSVPAERVAQESDLCVVLGGDGTLLRVAQLDPKGPVLAVNAGNLGFVTEVASSQVVRALQGMLSGQTRIASRMMLEADVMRGGKRVARYHALNDAVLHSMALARLTRLIVRVDGEAVTEFRADGAIVATPTGSTAYSMACDGPIILPALDALLLTPICAHPLTLRPLVVPPSSEIAVEVGEPRQKTMLTVDGQIGLELAPGDVVVVRRRRRRFRLAQLATTSYFATLREKLRW